MNRSVKQHRDKVFTLIEEKINRIAKQHGCFTMQVPFVVIDCEKRG